jgi:CheY-like chemotaxis protein
MARILVVDDTEAGLDLVGYLVRVRGHELTFARSGEEAVESALASMPDLILMDLQMPGMNGYEALRAIQESSHPDLCPVLALTAFAMVGEREKSLAAGFVGYFSKPIAPETFMDQLEAFIDRDHRRVLR